MLPLLRKFKRLYPEDSDKLFALKYHMTSVVDAIDETMKELLHQEVPERADSFVMSLYAIAQDMTFDDWQEFWLDMGIRIYNAEEGFNDYK